MIKYLRSIFHEMHIIIYIIDEYFVIGVSYDYIAIQLN